MACKKEKILFVQFMFDCKEELYSCLTETSLLLISLNLISFHINLGITRGCKACPCLNGREREGEEEGSSVVVHFSLKCCVGRSAPSHRCCCCGEKRQDKGLPVLSKRCSFAGVAEL